MYRRWAKLRSSLASRTFSAAVSMSYSIALELELFASVS
jgi:hypothetical protein